MGGDAPGKPFGKFPDHVNSVIDEMLRRPYTRYCPLNAWQPDVNLYETADRYIVCVALGGMRKEDFDVTVQSDLLMIRGVRPRPLPPDAPGDLRVHLMEINSGEFCREVEIPSIVRQDEITAEYRDGLLWISLPKSSEEERG